MNKIKLFTAITLVIVCGNACKETEVVQPREEVLSFLGDIRPTFFDKTNFDSKKVIAETPAFIEDFTKTYNRLEEQYKAGEFKSHIELEDMQLAGMYYSFYIIGVCATYMEKDITFQEIIGNRKEGLFSGLPISSINFEEKEMDAMIERARFVSKQSTYMNGFNDRTYGTYLITLQIQKRLKNQHHFSDSYAQDSLLKYMNSSIVNYNDVGIWNILMSAFTMADYKDHLNTFDNPKMDVALSVFDSRIVPGSLKDLGGRVPEILGPLYRLDMNLKKIDWTLKKKQSVSSDDITKIRAYIKTLEVTSGFIENSKGKVLNAWVYKDTFEQRKQKINELKDYVQVISSGKPSTNQFDLEPFINSKGFKKAYTCYGCHQATGL
jgi:hypothetical protein